MRCTVASVAQLHPPITQGVLMNRQIHSLAFIAASILSVPKSAAAQQGQQSPPPPPPPQGQVQAQVQAQASTTPSNPPAAPSAQEVVEKAEVGDMHFRWGFSAFGGPLVGGLSGGGGGIDTRFGVQLDKTFGIYGQPILMVAAGASTETSPTGAKASASAAALYGLGVLGEAALGDFFYVGLGPELLNGALGSASVSGGSSASASAATGPFFSVASRLGLALGSTGKRRRAFTVGLDMHLVFAAGTVLLPGIALGYESF